MQVTGVKIVLGTGAAMVLALAFGNIEPLTALIGRADVALQKIPTAAWFFAPLLLTVVVWLAERFGLIQPLFGTLYKDLTDSQIASGNHLSEADKMRLKGMLDGWNNPMPHLKRADHALVLWGGYVRWRADGFGRCWTFSLIYGFGMLLLSWAYTNTGQLGAATVIEPIRETWLRWIQLTVVGVAICGLYLLSSWAEHSQPTRLAAEAQVSSPLAIPVFRRVWFTVIAAIVIAGAIPLANTFAVVLTIAIVLVFVVVMQALLLKYDERANHTSARSRSHSFATVSRWAAACLAIFITMAALVPALSHWGLTLRKDALAASSVSFILIFMFGFLPLINAVVDWVSINATRTFIARMQAGAPRGEVGRLYFYDVAVALALTVIDYAAALAVIWMMQRFGWQVDVKSVLVELRDNPWSGQSTWLLTLAVTNFIPTLIHVALWMFGSVQSRDADTRAHIEQFLRDGGSSAPRQIAPTIVSMLRLQPWLERAMVLSLTLALIPLFAICVPWAADWLLQRL